VKGSREDITFATRSARRFPSGLRLRPSRSLGSRREWSIASSLDFVGIYLVRLSPMIPPTADFVWSYSESVRARLRRGFNSPTFAPGCNECSFPLGEMSVRSAWVSFCRGWRRRGWMVFPRRRMNPRGCHCSPLSGPVFERPVPPQINQGRYNYYFEQQSHNCWDCRGFGSRSIGNLQRERFWPGSSVFAYSYGVIGRCRLQWSPSCWARA